MKVLHVSATFTAGVYEAIKQYSANTPAVEHHLLVERRAASDMPPAESTAFFSGKGPTSIWEIRRAVRSVSPNVVHVHSSWAGFWARLALANSPLVYQPHGLASEGYGSTRSLRFIYSAVEKALAPKTEAFIALSDREHAVLSKIARGRTVHLIENTASLPEAQRDRWAPPRIPTFGMMGRIFPQKDPEFFRQFADAYNELHPPANFVWIGDGDVRIRSELEAAGIRVTGWLSADEVARELSQLSIYVHTSLYEGYSLSILDAALVGVPILLRDVPSSAGIELAMFTSVSEAVDLAARAVGSMDRLGKLHESSAALTDGHTSAKQREQLMHIYEVASRIAPRRPAGG